MTSSVQRQEIALPGCGPVPLASYLKALGLFRVVAEQADADARAHWDASAFRLQTRISSQELQAFLLGRYAPSPVVSPWNAGSGFFFREGKTREKDAATGKLLKTGVRNEPTEATRALEQIAHAATPRLTAFRESAAAAREELRGRSLDRAPEGAAKVGVVRDLRSTGPEDLLPWIDASALVVVDTSRIARELSVQFPPLLGSGGNDGNLDFSTTVVQALLSLMDLETGAPTEAAASWLRAALFGAAVPSVHDVAVSQYDPGAAGGPNSGAGFWGRAGGNPWDIVLGFEGTLLVSAAVGRRMASTSGSFPFTLGRSGTIGAGSGHVDPSDDATSRGEFWAPVWDRPVSYGELRLLFREGRAVVGTRRAANALDFAQAIAQLGVERGVSSFQRFGFEQRNGNMYLGVPLARFGVRRNTNADLIADLDARGWLTRVRRATRVREAPASVRAFGRDLDNALFELTAVTGPEPVQEAIVALGQLLLATSARPALREVVPPPGRLASGWAEAADDDSPEFALAASLASLHGQSQSVQLPFRSHLAPLEPGARDVWADTTLARSLCVWIGRNLLRDLVAVLERRILEAQRTRFLRRGEDGSEAPELPLRGYRVAPLASVASFLAGGVDHGRVAALAAGLAWVRGSRRLERRTRERDQPLPLAYCLLKPLFRPDGIGPDEANRKLMDLLPLVRLLEAARIDDAMALATRIARGAGLPTPFAHASAKGVDVQRLLASLVFPIAPLAYGALESRAYNLNNQEEQPDYAI